MLSPGERLGPYEIVSSIGMSGMGEVYSARDTRLGRTVAIKRMQDRVSDRFQREARAISALNDPNICQLYDVGDDYVVMELVDGGPVGPVETPRKLLDLPVADVSVDQDSGRLKADGHITQSARSSVQYPS